MSTITDNDLRELKDLINSKFEQVNDKLNDMRVDIATLKEGQNGINKRLDDTNKRIDNLDLLTRIIFGGVIVALIVGLFKVLYPNVIIG
jgi:predicted nuclease with TOPRIM domain